MTITKKQAEKIKTFLISRLKQEKGIRKIVIFGSFLNTSSPNDLDVAIFQDSSEDYLSLVLKYRQKTRSLSQEIPIDIFPLAPARKGIADPRAPLRRL